MTEEFEKNLLERISDGVYFVDLQRQITLWNHGAEMITGYAAGDVVGSSCADNILVHLDEQGQSLCAGHCPLNSVAQTGTVYQKRVYLHHKNGQRVQVDTTALPIFDEKGNISGVAEVFRETSARRDDELMEELRKAALLDSLTGIANRRSLDMKLKAAHEEFRRYGICYGVILGDIDHFKNVNDTYGHGTGDDVLTMVARTLSGNIRISDVAGRWGGEEFLLIITHTTPELLKTKAEKLRMLVENSYLEREYGVLRVTISLGAAVAVPDEDPGQLLERVDTLLYEAKKGGRNRVVCHVMPSSGGVV